MAIILIRVDDRLVHGQIVQGWLKTLDVDVVLVVSDLAANNKIQQTLMELALPSSIRLDIKTLKDATTSLINREYDKENIMILAAYPSEVLYMIEKGLEITSLNIGGMHFINGRKQLAENVCVNNEDIENLRQIYSKGIEIESRVLPNDDKLNIMDILEKEYQTVCKVDK
ncbi:MAG: PTS sugar transporter subunit IIB [Endomicrobium sp.]|jgi:PTS system mannose-specific IIB component|uniref:PTS system mannose/fructose/N-acetylgalactosamine-transporter subunit IIB n=1 Tax=Candidatus Endomicrobiellum cubanum TaxID=3242325 RepID=UPI00282064C6|nr:PTS sugar transporter subunit IIB [Endomicrobium sp.]